ncbi:hypothetical protein GQ651_01775 [Alphaproteobacteria bacterium GH1-50]|uniref:Multidrug resistance efflux pump n=1 Tax=Kangsaoukella pontilimi TaxID=2691042 RepID=A0A7C9IQQ7_9RHOB|nr:hypothetical protein [Kangsaoukella pontilimi]MXQ06566.1 hypothetical protein [Kangsaoukella pontilimi]
MLGSRKIRVAAGIFVLAAVWNLLWPRVHFYVSTDAVIDAPVIAVRAPVDGTIVAASPGLGAPVRPETTLLRLQRNPDMELGAARLRGEALAARAEVDALDAEIARTKGRIAALEDRARQEARIEIAFLTARLTEAVEERRRYEALWDQAVRALDRQRRLGEAGSVADARVEAAEGEVAVADALIAGADARIAAIRLEIEALEAGLPTPSGTGRRDAALDRLEDLGLLVSDLATRRAIAQGRLDGLTARLRETGDLPDMPEHFAPAAATTGVIWRPSPPAGASAARGADLAEVLDCSRRFLEVVLDESIIEQVPPGTPARVRLRGAETSFLARVAFRRAVGGGTALTQELQDEPANMRGGGVRVYLTLPPADIAADGVAERFCDVGRTAEVQIDRPPVLPRVAAWIERARDFFEPEGTIAGTGRAASSG